MDAPSSHAKEIFGNYYIKIDKANFMLSRYAADESVIIWSIVVYEKLRDLYPFVEK